jgi:hypothetical protein
VPRRVDQRVEVLLRLELLESEVDGDSSFSLVLQLVQDPRILEGVSSARLLALLCILLDSPIVYRSKVKEEVAHAGALPMVYVASYNQV